MSNRNQQTSNSSPGKGPNPGKPNVPERGKNPDYPQPGEPVYPEPDGTGGSTTTPRK
jgi:hypothetical protein